MIGKSPPNALGGGIQGLFHTIISVPNLFLAWKEFSNTKHKKKDVLLFEQNLEENLFNLHLELLNKKYVPNQYIDFYVADPKLRHIHKATVRDRVVHQAIFRIISPTFDKSFVNTSYSARIGKGTHKASKELFFKIRRASKNWHLNIHALKCDVRKFFDSVDHKKLLKLICLKIKDAETINLIKIILSSFEKSRRKGLPLGNVTSQLFGNIYLHELDRFVKHSLRAKHYFRYCDDFVILEKSKTKLYYYEKQVTLFLKSELYLDIHPNKIIYRTSRQGIDFCGYVVLPHTMVLRPTTKKRILRKLMQTKGEQKEHLINSYKGVVLHSSEKRLLEYIKNC